MRSHHSVLAPSLPRLRCHGNTWLGLAFLWAGARAQTEIVPPAVDPLTPAEALNKTVDGANMRLVFSDEFEIKQKFTVADSADERGNASLKWSPHFVPGAETAGAVYYIPELAEITGGNMVITIKNNRRFGMATYQSAQISTWNKFCFQGGYIEASYLPPLPTDQLTVNGLWVGIWTLANLVRANYGGSAQGQWPFSYDECVPFEGVATTGGNINGDQQRISRCDAKKERYGLNRMQGRGGTTAQATAAGWSPAPHSWTLDETRSTPAGPRRCRA